MSAARIAMWWQDTVRNEAYRRGIEATVEEDDLVVDIGTGSGLLALMAAKAGAHHVFAIEGDPALERAARRVVAANGKAESVTVVGRHSTQVKVGFGADVPTGADVIVTEIFDSWLLGEGMVPVMHDAVARGLLEPHGRVVPAGAQVSGFEAPPTLPLFPLTHALTPHGRVVSAHRSGPSWSSQNGWHGINSCLRVPSEAVWGACDRGKRQKRPDGPPRSRSR